MKGTILCLLDKMSAPSEAGASKLDNPAHVKVSHQHGIESHA